MQRLMLYIRGLVLHDFVDEIYKKKSLKRSFKCSSKCIIFLQSHILALKLNFLDNTFTQQTAVNYL